jgi:hypothetical protein
MSKHLGGAFKPLHAPRNLKRKEANNMKYEKPEVATPAAAETVRSQGKFMLSFT